MYTNILRKEVINIIDNILGNNTEIETSTRKEIIRNNNETKLLPV
jgi:hypothetical protein